MDDIFSSPRPLSRAGSNSSSESLCPIYKDTRSQDSARLTPCGRKFDLECVKAVMEDCQLRDQCPLCRVKPTEVRYAFIEDGRYSTYIPGGILPPPYPNHGRNIAPLPADQEDQPPITPAQVQRSLLVYRLRQMPIYDSGVWAIPPEQAYIIENQNYIVATRGLWLRMTQRHTGTKAILLRALKLHPIPIHSADPTDVLHLDLTLPPKPADVAAARAEIEAVLAGLGAMCARGRFAKLVIDDAKILEFADPEEVQGLDVSVEKTLTVFREREDALVSKMRLERLTRLVEMLLDDLGSERTPYQIETVAVFSAQERQRAARLARMEIQAVLETVMSSVQDF
jgi:hypothetical protein